MCALLEFARFRSRMEIGQTTPPKFDHDGLILRDDTMGKCNMLARFRFQSEIGASKLTDYFGDKVFYIF